MFKWSPLASSKLASSWYLPKSLLNFPPSRMSSTYCHKYKITIFKDYNSLCHPFKLIHEPIETFWLSKTNGPGLQISLTLVVSSPSFLEGHSWAKKLTFKIMSTLWTILLQDCEKYLWFWILSLIGHCNSFCWWHKTMFWQLSNTWFIQSHTSFVAFVKVT